MSERINSEKQDIGNQDYIKTMGNVEPLDAQKAKERQYDRRIVTDGVNKDGEHLSLLRRLSSEKIRNTDVYNNRGKYIIFTEDGQEAGFINVSVFNTRESDTVEIEYGSREEFRNKGNITLALREVLKDIFIDESFDGRPIKPFFPNTKIEKAFLAINADNHASQSVAEKSGLTQRENVYEITKQGFLEQMHNS